MDHYWRKGRKGTIIWPNFGRFMTKLRFTELMEALHFNDDARASPPGSPAFDKLFKLRPVVESLNAAWIRSDVMDLGWAVAIRSTR
jgi:hypothetical protein